MEEWATLGLLPFVTVFFKTFSRKISFVDGVSVR